ncbi:ABC transporter substrate-binding protein [Roseomonas elaeocarpi]|uniref:ABC transporter substrate-binding protein n=1 Tax=Roseomonas elaeocarpi TaxID=907779 RepID=A0ABV6JTC2_9PROT
MNEFRRRSLLGAGLGLGALAATGTSHRAEAAETRMAVQWFGANDRAKRTFAVIDLFEKRNPGVKINGEYGNSTDYWQKINTQIAGRNGPDVFQTEPNSIADYARRGALLALDPLLGKAIDTSGFSPEMLDLCRIDGKVYGLGLGLNSFGMLYDSEVFTKVGMAPPDEKTSWDDYAKLSVELTKANKRDGWFGSCDGSRYSHALNVWLRQRGKDLFNNDGKLDFTADEAGEWFSYWDKIRKAGGCVPADVASQDQSSIQTMPLVLNKAGLALMYSNQLVGTQDVVPFKLGLTVYPNGGPGAKPGLFYRPALIWNMYVRGRNQEMAAKFVNFFLNDPEAVKILGVERGVPMGQKMRDLVMPDLNELERKTVDYINFIADKVGPYPPPQPVNSNQFTNIILRAVADEVAFGRISPSEGGRKLINDTNAVL